MAQKRSSQGNLFPSAPNPMTWLQKLGLELPPPPTVVLCYDLYQGESVEEWCGRNPELAPDPDAEPVIWVLPERPLPRPRAEIG